MMHMDWGRLFQSLGAATEKHDHLWIWNVNEELLKGLDKMILEDSH